MRTGIANLPLHGGKAPAWLFQRMRKLAREIATFIVEEHGPDDLLRKISDPFWFQALGCVLGCVLGFDWHSSGVTTTACGALKEGLKDIQHELGFFVTGGKGGTSRKTPSEIETHCEKTGGDAPRLVYASRLSAKIDSAAVQDGYQLYHHCFFFTQSGLWAVVQQGMNEATRYARRYHWLSEAVGDFVCEPHLAVCCDRRTETLNMVAEESRSARDVVADLSRLDPDKLLSELTRIETLDLPARHHVSPRQDISPSRMQKILLTTYERQPEDFETLLGMKGVGAKTIRSLSLIAELVYGTKPSYRDPAKFSFAHGGKDGHPYPVDKATYDRSIEILKKSINAAKLGDKDRLHAIRRLVAWSGVDV